MILPWGSMGMVDFHGKILENPHEKVGDDWVFSSSCLMVNVHECKKWYNWQWNSNLHWDGSRVFFSRKPLFSFHGKVHKASCRCSPLSQSIALCYMSSMGVSEILLENPIPTFHPLVYHLPYEDMTIWRLPIFRQIHIPTIISVIWCYSKLTILKLVGGWVLPLWKIWVRQLGWWHSQYMEKLFQTTNQ